MVKGRYVGTDLLVNNFEAYRTEQVERVRSKACRTEQDERVRSEARRTEQDERVRIKADKYIELLVMRRRLVELERFRLEPVSYTHLTLPTTPYV